MIPRFDDRYNTALHDERLRATLLEFQRTWRRSRDHAIDPTQFEADHATLAHVKDRVIENLPEYIDRFTRSAMGAGAIIHRAVDADDAVRYIVNVAMQHGATVAIKSKSMASEEIDLNAGLEAAGIRPVETDLGEWIVQLAGERPSHIVGPALHKNRLQVAELLRKVTRLPVSDTDIAQQVSVARTAMRAEFLAGHIGITGGNILVADCGTLVIATNEGNAELVTSLPPVHVALVGIEKIVPTMDDAMLQLRLLAPSATGQSTTTYVTFTTGPSSPDREMHIVLLDNGRSDMRADLNFREALRCIRCGACSSVCPSYGAVGGHVFGYVYSGAIGLVNTPFHHGLDHAAGPQSLCVSCGACGAVCPVEIPLPRQILDTRASGMERRSAPIALRSVIELWSRPSAFRFSARLAGVAQMPFQRGPVLKPPVGSKYTDWRAPPAVSRTPFRSRPLPRVVPHTFPLAQTLEGTRITYFVQCLTDWIVPDTGSAVVNVLSRLGAHVTFPKAQHCCGLSAIDAGSIAPAKRMARHTISVLEAAGGDYIVTGGTSCAVAMLHDYPHLFRDEPAWKERALALGSRIMDFTTFMHAVARLPVGSLNNDVSTPATYHYFCQSFNVLRFRNEPLRLLHDVCGVHLEPLPEANVCCGFGGSVSVQRPEVCAHIVDRKLANIANTGVGLLVTDNPGCIMHLRGAVAARGGTLQVKHTAEIVAAALQRVQSKYH